MSGSVGLTSNSVPSQLNGHNDFNKYQDAKVFVTSGIDES